jgi:hypothetical protein
MTPEVAGLPHAVADRILGSVAFTQSPELSRLGERGQQLADLGRQAFVDGVGSALQIAAGVALVTAVVVALIGPRRVASISGLQATAGGPSSLAGTTRGVDATAGGHIGGTVRSVG